MVPFDVFLSHEGNDKPRIVADLAKDLKAAGYKVFLDVESIGPGERFPEKIEVSCFMSGRSTRNWLLCGARLPPYGSFLALPF
jgi:hypothetical protein